MQELTFYTFPWDGPTTAVIEYNGVFYEIRKSWGNAEGWTNDYGATPLSDEELQRYRDDLLEQNENEVYAEFSKDDVEHMLLAVKAAAGKTKSK